VFSLAVFSLLIIYFINKYRKVISKKTKLIDKPDKIRKLHKKPTPLLGGTMVFSSFLLINLYLIFFKDLNSSSLIILASCFCCLVLGFVDDIKKISYKYKFLILIIIFLFVSLDTNFQINKIYISTFNKEFYLTSLIGAGEYSIQGRPEFDPSDVVPLSYKALTSGNYSIAIDHADGLFTNTNQAIYLKDNLTATEHNLQTSAYNFTSVAGTFTNRFEIIYQSQLSIENPTFNANQVIVYKNELNDFVINAGTTIMASVKVFDIRGRLLLERNNINASQTNMTVGMANEVLLVQITSEDGVVVIKKVVR
jgi:hypothetical protein